MRYLFVIRRAPYDGLRAIETLDLLLTVVAFDQTVEVVFVDDGVWQLSRNQRPQALAQRDVAAVWQTLEVYGIDPPWVENESLCERRIKASDLVLPVRSLPRARLAGLMREYDRVLGD